MEDKLTIYQCGYMKNIPDHKWGPAVRNHYLIHYAVAGCGTYTVDGTTYALRAGQGFLIEPFVITTYQADHDDPWEYYWFGFYGGEASYLITEAGFECAKSRISLAAQRNEGYSGRNEHDQRTGEYEPL